MVDSLYHHVERKREGPVQLSVRVQRGWFCTKLVPQIRVTVDVFIGATSETAIRSYDQWRDMTLEDLALEKSR